MESLPRIYEEFSNLKIKKKLNFNAIKNLRISLSSTKHVLGICHALFRLIKNKKQ